MPELNDHELLAEFARTESETAFATLVARYVNLVYSTALRFTGNPSHAEEITQAVFIILARKAGKLSSGVVLSGWLYQAARLTAANLVKGEIRRHHREQEAYMQTILNEPDTMTWKQIAPLLDEAMGGLGETDRNVVVLRFFENKTAAEVADALKLTEAAAHKRVNRALEKLRNFFTKRGVSSTTAIIAGTISANSVQAAPVALAKSVTAVAIAKGAVASGSTLTLIKGALKLMAWSKAKTAIVIGIGILLVAGTTTVTVQEIAAHRVQVWQKGFDMAVLDAAPRQAIILPALHSRSADIKGWRSYHGMIMGLNRSVPDIVAVAYNVSSARVIFSVPVPEGKYDFISNTPKNQNEALRQEIKKKFGLVGRLELIDTNVLVLAVRNHNAPGLKRVTSAGLNSGESNGFVFWNNYPVASLTRLFEVYLGTPVVDRTGLTGYFDLKYDAADDTPDGLKKAVLDNLGLELIPGNGRVEFVVINKVN